MITKEQKIDILSRYCADQIGHGMREKVYDVIKHVVDFLESDRASEVGVQPEVMPKIADTWLNDKCINKSCWFYNIVTKNNCANKEINDDITGCSPRAEHKQLLNEIIGKERADKISNDSNFTA